MYARSSKGGFTLIECLAAALILGIGIVGVASMFTYANVSEQEAANLAQARAVADQTLEAVRAQGYAALAGASGTQQVVVPGLPRGVGILAWRPYPNEMSDEGLKLVALNVTWRGAGRRAGRYWVTTLVAREGGS